MLKKIGLMSLLIVVQACSPLPYNNDFGCKRKEAHGKCVSVEEAYEEAVTGVPKGVPLGSDQKKIAHSPEVEITSSIGGVIQREDPDIIYNDYKEETLKKLTTMVSQPNNPVIKNPVHNRTLILPYIPDGDNQRLYQARYIDSINEKAKFVFGHYNLEEDPSLPDFNELAPK